MENIVKEYVVPSHQGVKLVQVTFVHSDILVVFAV